MYKILFQVKNETAPRSMTFSSYEIAHKTILKLYQKYGYDLEVDIQFLR